MNGHPRTDQTVAQTVAIQHQSDRWLSLVALASAGIGLGDFLVALAGVRARSGQTGVLVLYWLGIALLYGAPTAAALVCRRDRRALLILVVLLAAGLYVVSLVNSPLGLTTTDELQTLRSLNDLQRSHHLFSLNPLVQAYPRFPGSQIAIVTMQRLTRLSMSTSARLVIGPEQLLMCVALFALLERVSGSALAGYAGALVYTTNASYLYFDTQVFYESFALPLAILTLLLVVLAVRSPSVRERRIILSLATVTGVVVCLSHHMTSYWLAVILLVWWGLAAFRKLREPSSSNEVVPWVPAASISLFAALWYAFVAHAQVVHELGPVYDAGFKAIKAVVSGSIAPKAPFSSPSALAILNDPVSLQVIGYLSVVLVLLILVSGLLQGLFDRGRHARLQQRSVRRVEILVFSVAALIYPVGLVLRFTQASTETSSRSSEFAFVGIAVMAALFVSARVKNVSTENSVETASTSRRVAVVAGVMATIAAVVLAFGGVIVGQAPYDRLAGTYLVGADLRSVEPFGQETAQWAAHHWPSGAKFAADATNTRLIASAGDFTPEDGTVDGDPVNHLFLSRSVDAEDIRIINGDKIKYVVIDERLTRFPSASGPAFGGSEPGVKVQPSAPVPSVDFTKFASSKQFSQVYDNGSIRVYMTKLG